MRRSSLPAAYPNSLVNTDTIAWWQSGFRAAEQVLFIQSFLQFMRIWGGLLSSLESYSPSLFELCGSLVVDEVALRSTNRDEDEFLQQTCRVSSGMRRWGGLSLDKSWLHRYYHWKWHHSEMEIQCCTRYSFEVSRRWSMIHLHQETSTSDTQV